jgi:hypothetical protein
MPDRADVNEQKFMAAVFGLGMLGWLFNAVNDGSFLSWLCAGTLGHHGESARFQAGRQTSQTRCAARGLKPRTDRREPRRPRTPFPHDAGAEIITQRERGSTCYILVDGVDIEQDSRYLRSRHALQLLRRDRAPARHRPDRDRPSTHQSTPAHTHRARVLRRDRTLPPQPARRPTNRRHPTHEHSASHPSHTHMTRTR